MRNTIVVVLVMSIMLFAACSKPEPEESKLVIYAYDSFISEWGPGPVVIPPFEEKYGIQVEVKALGDAGQVLATAILERDKPKSDIILGIDNNMLPEALNADILEPYTSPALDNVSEHLQFDSTHHVTPYDFGYFSIIYDSEKIPNPPKSLEDLTKDEFAEALILMDPRTSSPGLGFLLWTKAVYGKEYLAYWKRLEGSILTITDGWDSGYGMFTSGEAPMVLSYTTSPAYHAEYETSGKYLAALFDEGHYMQIEGMGITKGTAHKKAAQQFIDYVLSNEFQSQIPLLQWMYPVNEEITLPDSFEWAPKPEKPLILPLDQITGKTEGWIQDWVETLN